MFRKIRSGGINLLGGRARTKYLHPLTYKELSGRFELFKTIEQGLYRFAVGAAAPRIANAYIIRYEKHRQRSFLRMGFQCRYLKA